MKRRLSTIFLTLGFLLALTVPASADLLWEPWDNAFYQSMEYESDTYLARIYVVPDGMTANVYKSPETGGVLATLEAGTRIYLGPAVQLGDVTWAAGYPIGSYDVEGWVNVNRLQRTYEHQDFVEDFQDLFQETDEVIGASDVTSDIRTWTYPASGVPDHTISQKCLGTDYNDGVVSFRYFYTDPQGGRWGYVGYYMGHCGWVWLDDPTADETPVFPQTPENTVLDTSEEQPLSNNLFILLVTAGLVLIVATAAGIWIVSLKKRKH